MPTSDKINFDRQGSASVWQFEDDGDYWKIRKSQLPAYKAWVEQEIRERLAKEQEHDREKLLGGFAHNPKDCEMCALLRKDITS